MTTRIKGNMIIGQAGGPTVVINRSLIGAVMEAFNHSEIKNIYGMLNGIEGILEDKIIDFRKEDKKLLKLVANTPSSALGSCRHKPNEDECEQIFDKLQKMDVRYFFYCGGNDSAETANILNEIAISKNYDIRIFHVPKTVDNDLRETDHCPGYASAAKYVAMCFQGNNMDNASLPGIKVDVVMGRNAGWLTAAAGLAGQDNIDGPHLIYVPERPVSLEQFCKNVLTTQDKYGRALVAVSEGIRGLDGRLLIESQITEKDSHGNLQLSGSSMLGDYLMAELKKAAGGKTLRVRSDTLGYAERSFPEIFSTNDVKEAWMVGEQAVKFATGGKYSAGSVTILAERGGGLKYSSRAGYVELNKVAKVTKDLPLEYMNEQGNNVTQAFIDYIKPLVGKLPRMGILQKVKVKF